MQRPVFAAAFFPQKVVIDEYYSINAPQLCVFLINWPIGDRLRVNCVPGKMRVEEKVRFEKHRTHWENTG